MKRVFRLAALIAAGAAALSMSACGSSGEGSGASAQTTAAEKTYALGIIQYATHASLDNCRTGFVLGLEESGIIEGENLTINFQNAQGQMANSDLQAKNMVTSKADMIMAIATPAAMSAYSAAKENGIPVIFTAISDPMAAGIVKSLENPGTNCTGTSDVLNFDAQLKMIRAFLPDAEKIGVIYTTSEANSISHLEKFKSLAPDYGFEVVSMGVTDASEVAAAAAAIVSKGVDCINNFTDNNVVDNLSTVLHEASAAGIPVFGSEVEQVKNGCLASESIDYIQVGREAGIMAAKVLKGEADITEMPVASISDTTPVYNPEVLEALGIALPADYSAAAGVTAD